MKLRLLTPIKVVVDQAVTKITAEAVHGHFCLLPQHIDFLATLVPGLLSFQDDAGNEQFVAVDHGVLVKRGEEVLVSVRQATSGTDLEQLRTTVRKEFAMLDEAERTARSASARLEASFMRNYLEFVEQAP